MTWTETKTRFDEDGFAVVRRLLDGGAVADVRRALERYVRDVLPHLDGDAAIFDRPGVSSTLRALTKLHVHDAYFDGLLHSTRLLGLAETLLAKPVKSAYVETFRKGPGCVERTPPHQDASFFGSVLGVAPGEALTTWLALDPIDEANGCLHYVRGSNRRGPRPEERSPSRFFSRVVSDFGGEDMELAHPVHLEPGDAVIHHPLTIHFAEGNGSGRERRALVFTYFSRELNGS